MNGDCQYIFDGTDTDGTKWYMCTTHNELALSDVAPCAGYEEIPYTEKCICSGCGNEHEISNQEQ